MTMCFNSESSSSSPRVGCTYDVFLSFRGDTRKNFTDHLYGALVQAGIHTFRDDKALDRGEVISPRLLEAIQESRISIVVFSKGYASSTWCLDELAKIMECRNTISQIVLPVFYDIEPSDIRKQTGSFAEAFKVHEELFKKEMQKVNKWRGALKDASNLSGYPLNDMANGHESTFIQNIVEDILNKLTRKYLHVAKHPVGIDSRVDNMIAWLRTEANDVRIVGICGMPGIGKTTIAKVVFNQLYDGCEGSCFLKNVAEKSQRPNGMVQLQEELLCEILKRDSWNINNEDRGINLIKERLHKKRVLVVLDDVEQQKQLDALVVDGSLFGVGSIIIITTRNEHLLNQFEVVVKYHTKFLNDDESLQLFSWHAFGDPCPPNDYVELSNKVVDYSGGLPLALEVLGSCLPKKDKIRWESVIDKLRKVPNHDIQEKLRISFDTLNDDRQQNAFLDIACFLIGREKEYVIKVLEARYGFNPEDDLENLIERSLITINVSGEVNMHDLLRDMGREIVRKISPDHPGKRNRIWHHEDAMNVLIKKMGTKAVEGLAVDVRESKVEILTTESFAKMKHLQLLKINGVNLIGCFKVLPKWLIWLCWQGCPLKLFPSDFELGNLVILDMQYSSIKELWQGTKILEKLKILNLSYCEDLAKLPNFIGLSNLERLILKNCRSLVEVPQSIGHLKMLVFLNLEGCWRLKILSESICYIKSLEKLSISGCSQLKKLPEGMDDMESLTELLADGIENEQILSSIVNLKYVRSLSLRGYRFDEDSPSWLSPRDLNWKALLRASFSGWRLLRELKIDYLGLSEGTTNCADFGSLSSLETLDLSGNRFLNLPSGISCLPKLQVLIVSNCKDLELLSDLPSSLVELLANDCTSMKLVRLPIQSKTRPSLFVDGCENLIDIEGMEGLGDGLSIYSEGCNRLSKNYKMSLLEALSNNDHIYEVYFPNGDVPDWFSYRGRECSLSFHLPPLFQGLVLWIVFETEEHYSSLGVVRIKNKGNGIQLFQSFLRECSAVWHHTSWITFVRTNEMPIEEFCGEEWELCVDIRKDDRNGCKVKECGVHVIADRTDSFEESEWDHEIDNLQGPCSSADVECETESQTVIPKLYHRLHHPPLGSISSSTYEQWISYLIMELPIWDVFCATLSQKEMLF